MQATQTVFTIDPAHSSVDFSVKHMMFSKVRGAFNGVSGTVTLAEGSNVPLSVNAEIDATSIDTRNNDRDAHLRSPDFLEADTFSKITFSGTDVKKLGESEFELVGQLTIHGVSRPVSLQGEVDGRGKDPWGNDRIAFSATGRINRKDFGLTWNQAMETGGILVGEEIDIAISVQAIAPAA